MARERKTDPAKDAAKTGQDELQELETTEREEDMAQEPQDKPERDIFAGISNPCVYCGPTVRGVARQYTTYQGGITDELRNFIREHPQARGLIVSTGHFASFHKRLNTPGTAEVNLYKQVKAELTAQ